MAVTLNQVVPFGRSFDEYVKMFTLTPGELQGRVISVGDGPASFNSEATKLGYKITSVDPIYQFHGAEIWRRFSEVVDNIINQVKATPNDWVWAYHQSPEHLKSNRIQAINKFIRDYEQGKKAGRYILGELPKLEFAEHEFDLALCSHFLFLYSEHFDYEFHRDSILEMLRISQEVRIFPLLTLKLERSPYLNQLTDELKSKGYSVSIVKVQYELQKGGNEMFIIKKKGEWSATAELPSLHQFSVQK